MSTAVLSNATAVVASRAAVLENGQYALVGFKRHEFTIDGKQRQTFAPVLAKIESGAATALYMVNRGDLTIKPLPIVLANQTGLAPGAIPLSKNNSGDVVTEITAIVSVEGVNSDARWMNKVLPQYRTTVFEVTATKFTGLSRKKTEYAAHVYEIKKVATTTYVPNPAQLMQLAALRNWKSEDLHGFDQQPVVFHDKNGQVIQFDSEGRLLSKMVKVGDDYIVDTTASA